MKKYIFFTILLVYSFRGISQEKYTISGSIKDKSGESLIGTSVYVSEIKAGTISNEYGFYSITLPKGKYNLVYSYVGYQTIKKDITLHKDIDLDIMLEEISHELKGVEVTAKKKRDNIRVAEMSTMKLQSKEIKKIPAFMGEVDIIKAIQMMPGVQTSSEGSSGFNVRGGSIDQNLILLDEATVYNASHLMGFFSVFNNDAIKDVKLYKGDMPASAGGRLSSLLDIRMKDGSNDSFHVNGGIGTISSRLTVQSPLIKNKSSFIMSGRRSYADLMLMFSKDEAVRKNKLYFYDLNLKTNYILNKNNRFYLSAYLGRDVLGMQEMVGMNWGNKTITGRWNHLFNNKLFSNLSVVYSDYDYELFQEDNTFDVRWTSRLKDFKIKEDLTYYPNPENTIRTGFSGTFHYFNPGWIRDENSDDPLITSLRVPDSHALNWAIYASNEWKPDPVFTLIYGLRFSAFHNVGASTVYQYDDNYVAVDSTNYDNFEFYNTYFGLEPRLSAMYQLNEKSSLKGSYSRTNQYVHLASNSTAGSPLDVWLPSSPNIKPQIADQVALGYFRNFWDDVFETSVEVYYKYMQNQIDFKDHPNLFLNDKIEGEMRIGNAWSYGIEFLVRKQVGKFTGWISYTLSKTKRQVKEINDGNPYLSNYDKPHNVSIVMSYEISKRLNVGLNWVYSTGNPVTFPLGKFEYYNTYVPIYSGRNEYRMPDYHRMDLSLNYTFGKVKNNQRRSELNLSIYNVYNRKNAWAITFQEDPDNPNATQALKTYLFPILPSLTYNFYF